jgi:hypothetical protein
MNCQILVTIGGMIYLHMQCETYAVFLLLSSCLFWVFSRLEIEGSGKVWKRDQKVRLRHVDTGGYLHSHSKKYNRLGGGQQEVRHLFVCKFSSCKNQKIRQP